MPANEYTSVKQYVVTLAAGEFKSITPALGTRNFIEIQVTGANPIRYRWENAVQLDNGDFILAANEYRQYSDPCPIQRLNLYAAAATTVAIAEGITVG